MKMPDPLKTQEIKTMSQAMSISMLPRALSLAGAFALTLGLFAASAPANATPMQAPSGVTAPGLQIQDVGYRRGKKYRQLYASEYDAPNSNYRAYRYAPYGGSDEIRELQRLFPQTNWPPSLRY